MAVLEEERERGWWPGIRVSSEFDSDSKSALHKVSCKVWEGLAKLKLSFHSDSSTAVTQPRLSLISKNLSVDLDLEDRNAIVNCSAGVGPHVQVSGTHDMKGQVGQVSVFAASESNNYSLRLSSPVPPVALPTALIRSPLADLQVDPAAASALLSVRGGLCSAQYSGEDLRLRYAFKDHELSLIPSLSLPSNAFSLAFKRRFSPSHKLSYWYNFDANNWSAVYKQNCGKDLKLKAGYDSEVHIAWASIWVGDECGKTKASPLKMKLQLMLQVPQHEFRSSEVLLKVKKRWDF